jgi:hypothetical protein
MAQQPPPWVVHLRFGNLRRHDFHSALARLWPAIEALLPMHKLVNVYLDCIEGERRRCPTSSPKQSVAQRWG